MILKAIIRGTVLAGAVVVPILCFSAVDIWSSTKNSVRELLSMNTLTAEEVKATAKPESSETGKSGAPGEPTLEGPPTRDLAEVFRFDATPGWVMQRWARVSTGLAQLQLQGYRVPLVTGIAENDLAGALTYYFNPQQQVQKITFNGTTGNPAKLVTFLTTRYRFKRRVVNDAGLLVYEARRLHDPAGSVLRVRTAGVVESNRSHRRFLVDLVIERPEKG